MKFVSLCGELGFQIRPLVLKLSRGLVEALTLAGLIDFDVVAEPIEFALLRGPLRLQLLGDAAALGLGLLAEHLELILLVGEPLFQFGGPSLATGKLLNLTGLLTVGRLDSGLSLANFRRRGFDLRLPAFQLVALSLDAVLPALEIGFAPLQLFLLTAEQLGGRPLLFGPPPLPFGKLKLRPVKIVDLPAENFGLFASFDAGGVRRGIALRGNRIEQRVNLRRQIDLNLFESGLLSGEQLLGAAPLSVERSAGALPSRLSSAGLRCLFFHGCRSRENAELPSRRAERPPRRGSFSRHRRKVNGEN
jgi:hypothetical protein